jgi:hypothetical protein
MSRDVGRLAHLLGWCGIALMAAGGLMVVATLLHPSRETATTIVASESRLVAAHVVYTLAWLLVLLGLPGLYAAQREGMGRLGLAGFLTAFAGTYLIAVTGNFGFLAPVLAKQSPAVLDSINQYLPVVIINGLAAILFMIGYVLFGVAMIRTSTLPRWSGWTGRGRRSGPFAWFRHRSAVATRCVSWSTPFGPARAPVSVRAVSPGKMAHSAVSARRVSCRGAEG